MAYLVHGAIREFSYHGDRLLELLLSGYPEIAPGLCWATSLTFDLISIDCIFYE